MMTIRIGPLTLDDPVPLPSMSGATDLPSRRLVERYGAGLVVAGRIPSQAAIRGPYEPLVERLVA